MVRGKGGGEGWEGFGLYPYELHAVLVINYCTLTIKASQLLWKRFIRLSSMIYTFATGSSLFPLLTYPFYSSYPRLFFPTFIRFPNHNH